MYALGAAIGGFTTGIFGAELALYLLIGGIGTAIIGLLLDRLQIQAILWAVVALPLIPAVLWWLWQNARNKVD